MAADQKKKYKQRNQTYTYSGKLGISRGHPRRWIEMKFCMVDGLQGIVLRFEFHQNQSSGFGAVGGRNLPIPVGLAIGLYNSSATLQAVMGLCKCSILLHSFHVKIIFRRVSFQQFLSLFIMVALWNRADHYIFALWFLLLLNLFPRLISAIADWMSAILPHVVCP